MTIPFSCARAPAPTPPGPGRIPWIEVSVSEAPGWRLHHAVAGLLPRAADVQAPEREEAEVYSEGSRELAAWR
jgi:hypothetical protein